jgi:hypothetical protein
VTHKVSRRTGVLAVLLGCALSLTAAADPPREHHGGPGGPGGPGRPGGEGPRGGMVIDHHYNHDRPYPPRGYVTGAVPHGAYAVPRRGGPYYYHGGSWYRPYGPRFVVAAPPFGVVVPFLPPFYTTLWVGGFPYYYANSVYYTWRPEQRGYEVVQPPPGAEEATVQPGSDEIFIYPRHGQTEQQQADDRYECHHWAVTQTGYDPTRPPGPEAAAKRPDYYRAMRACLEGRDYSVQ